jgi:hypothetical protein
MNIRKVLEQAKFMFQDAIDPLDPMHFGTVFCHPSATGPCHAMQADCGIFVIDIVSLDPNGE